MYDPILRPVESPPVGVQFMDPMQAPIKIPAYRSNAVKLAFMKDMIQEPLPINGWNYKATFKGNK